MFSFTVAMNLKIENKKNNNIWAWLKDGSCLACGWLGLVKWPNSADVA